MIFELPDKTLPRLEGMIENATATDGSPRLIVRLDIRHEDGSEPTDDEQAEIRAVLAGYGADGPLDGNVPVGSVLG
jgi:hypothetical protein